ncbi:Ig domain-containing protein [Thermoanaerobacterium thermosaccharolyticum]|uniref:Ig domain-containing protein n=1 Tax=Thermoanaerobacterium thermosaccharolyticum TaxID=1517 RepID=UPI00177D50D2|nr:Ig domain-containing protein [Thermoanaerobacterium thermosaccharolyticum]MBE0069875.1 Ig domain-containing protein [Thermoanaerobacterium thermosaccharolyticum]MBE0228003.1 Ig domain-containing protein [Thermoanaerobacterium thermosaccharolyticum]
MKIIRTLKEKKKYFIVSLIVLLFVMILIFVYASSSLTLTATPNSQGNYIHLQWNVPDNTQPYTYMLHMKKPGDSEFQTIPAKSQVKVLNVYPPSAYTISFSGNWTRASGYGYNSQYGYESTNHTNNSTSSTSLTVNMPSSGTISFWYMVSSETNYDFIRFYIDGQEKLKNSGNLGWQQVSFSVSAGQHTFTWSYTKDISVSSYNDTAYIDNVSITGIGTFTFESSDSLQIGVWQIPNITFTNWQGQTYTLPKSASLKMWMEQPNSDDPKGYGKGLISVDAVSITDFNNNPTAYLKNSNGSWKYDVIYFGAWDNNNGFDLSASAENMVETFIQNGRGILLGHDTIAHGVSLPYNATPFEQNFQKLAQYLNIQEVPSQYNGMAPPQLPNTYQTWGSTKVTISKKGLLTNYPWQIGDVGTILSVPYTHTGFEIANGDIWLRFADIEPLIAYDINGSPYYPNIGWTDSIINAWQQNPALNMNWYLTTWNNTAMIETGHSNGDATPDEQKILANTLFYLAQVTDQTSWDDHMGQDLTPPDKPKITNIQKNGNNINITFSDNDKGTTYSYYVEATGMNNGTKIDSNTVTTTITSGIKGYSVVIDNNPNTVPDNTIDTTSSNFSTTYSGSNFYVHVKAIDNAGNVSDAYTYCYSKPFITATPVPSQNAIQLNWGINDTSQTYSYMVYKKDINDSDFQTIPVKDHLKVLEVYPYISVLKDWMNNYGQGKISVDSIPIETFNSNPSIVWNYDVAVFGFADCNNHKGINDNAEQILDQYIQNGRGVLFGHDTIYPDNQRSNFNILAEKYLNMTYTGGNWYSGADPSKGFTIEGTSTIVITKKGLLTNYPYKIGDIGTELTVPPSHTSGHYANGDIWMRYDWNSQGMTDPLNFYLTTWNNVAMIQTGHSILPGIPVTQYATEDEQKLMANTLFYLGQVTTDTSWLDHSAQDLTPPDTVSGITTSQKDNQININWNIPKDNGNTYEYYVQATGNSDNLKRMSDTVTATITTGIKGYSYAIDQNPNTEPDNTVDTTSNNINVSISKEGTYYIHIKAIDNADNASQTVHYQFYVESPITIQPVNNSGSAQTTYAAGQAVKINVTTTGPVHRVTAQMWYSSNEYSSTGITDLVGGNGSWHTRQSNSEGYDTVVIIPKSTPDGTYNIIITAYAKYPDGTTDTKSITIPITVKGTIYDYYHSEINN